MQFLHDLVTTQENVWVFWDQSNNQWIGSLILYQLMLWSQIKLLPYDFSDLQITGSLRIAWALDDFNICMVKYPMGAGWRWNMVTSPILARRHTVPVDDL